MTRKDFEMIAEAVRAAYLNKESRLSVAAELATRLAGTNPRFNYEQFKKACGVES